MAAFAVSPLVAANYVSGATNTALTFSGSIYAHLDLAVGAWVGHAMVSIGNQPPKFATIVDQSTGAGAPPSHRTREGMWYGTELMVMTFVDGSGSIEFTSKYRATPESAPGLFELHEVCSITNGTGDYAGISGTASIQGPFIGASAAIEYNMNEDPSAPLLWISAVHGEVTGLVKK